MNSYECTFPQIRTSKFTASVSLLDLLFEKEKQFGTSSYHIPVAVWQWCSYFHKLSYLMTTNQLPLKLGQLSCSITFASQDLYSVLISEANPKPCCNCCN